MGTTEMLLETFSSIQCSMKLSKLLSLTKVSTPKLSLCMFAFSELQCSCFFLHSIFSQGRREVLDPSQWRLVPTMTEWITNGSQNQPSEPQVLAKLAHVKGKLSVVLVLTQNKCTTSSDRDDQDLAMQQASTHFDYLKVNGHQIWISDFSFTLDIGSPNLVFRHVQQLIRFKFIHASNLMLSKILFPFQLSV